MGFSPWGYCINMAVFMHKERGRGRTLRGQRVKEKCSVQRLIWLSCIFRSLSAPQKMSDLLQNGSSRYKEEFVEITRLGKGGFGSVFKVCMS